MSEVTTQAVQIGDKLRQARTAAGLEISDVAADLRINAEYLAALESNDFEAIGAPTYAKGYLRSYANALSLSPEALLEEFDSLGYAEPQLNTVTPIEGAISSKKWMHLFSILVVAAVVGLSSYGLFKKGYMSGPTASDETVEYTEPAAAEQNPLDTRTIPLVEIERSAGGENVSSTNLASIPLVAGQSSAVEVVADVLVEPAVTVLEPLDGANSSATTESVQVFSEGDFISADEGDDEVLLSLTQESWIEIEDAGHFQLMQGVFPAGTNKILRGQSPFQVFLGNAPGVELIFNDTVYNTTPHTRSNNTAKFALIN